MKKIRNFKSLSDLLKKEKTSTVTAVAKRIRMSRSTIYRRIKEGAFKAIRVSPRCYRVFDSSIDAYLKEINP